MRRRTLVAALAAALAAERQALAAEPARIVWIAPSSAAQEAERVAEVRAGLKEYGLVEGRDVTLEILYADGDYLRFPVLTRQALERKPAVLLVVTIASVRAAQQATSTVPIVLVGTNDPVGAGLIDSLARPGGNTTGVATMADEAALKVLDMMRTVLPQARRVRVALNPQNATNPPIAERLRATAAGFGIEVLPVAVPQPAAIETCLGPADAASPDAMIVVPDAMLVNGAPRFAALALARRVPLLGPFNEFPRAGALLSYGPSLLALNRRATFYIKRILAGAAPRDLPVEQPTKFELVLNLRTAGRLGVTVPASVVSIADETIE
jgi:putative ABC transport system substrate-binding protein